MRKQLKKALSMVLSAAMVVTLGSGIGFNTASADEAKTYSATLEGQCNVTWKNLTAQPTSITGDGTYTVTSTASDFTPSLVYLNIAGMEADLTAAGTHDTVKITDASLKIDGEAVTFNAEPQLNYDGGALQLIINNNWENIAIFDPAAHKVTKDIELTFTLTGTGLGGATDPVTPTDSVAPTETATAPAETATAPADTGTASAVFFEDAVDWTYGGDADCRLQIGNTWGNWPFDTKIVGKKFDRIAITFDASGVEDALAAASITEITGFLNYSIQGDERWPDADKDAADVTITKDGTYTVDCTLGSEAYIDGNFIAIRFNCLDKTVKQSDVEGGQTEGPLKFSNVKVALYGSGEAVEAPTPTEDPGPSTGGDPSYKGTWDEKGIHAYLFYQTDTWDYRNAYAAKTDGKADSYHYIQAGGADVTNTAQVVDAFLNKNGEYTVSISGIDLSGASKFNMLGISTDISKELYPDVKITEEKVSIDGTVVTSDDDLAPVGKEDDKTNNFLMINEWDGDRDTEGGTIHYPLGKKNADEELAMPENSIEITFKVEGLDKVLQDIKNGEYLDPETGDKIQNDNVEVPAVQEPTPTTQPTTAPEQTVGLEQGKSFTSGNFTYKVTKAATTSKNGTVAVSLSKKGKKAAKLTVGATVKNGDATYTINAIAKNGFKGAKAKQVTLGKNIKKIPAGAFAGCKKLSKLTLKAKLSSVAKKSFKGCKKKITVKGTAKKANVKKLKKSGYKKFK